jgi:hypothetical protein
VSTRSVYAMLTQNQFFGNHLGQPLRAFFAFWLPLWGGLLMLSACGPLPAINEGQTWQIHIRETGVPPQMEIGFWADQGGRYAAWAGLPQMPNLRLLPLRPSGQAPIPLALGIQPQAPLIFRLDEGRLQLLWRDMAGNGVLVGGTIRLRPAPDVERGPTVISQGRVGLFTAVQAAAGQIFAVWASADPDQANTPILATIIDGAGRPRDNILVATDGLYPAAAFDGAGVLHICWLGRMMPLADTFSIYCRRFPPAGREEDRLMGGDAAEMVGVLKLARGEAVTGLHLAASGDQVLVLWHILQPKLGPDGRLAGLIFPAMGYLPTQMITVEGKWRAFGSLHGSASVGRGLFWLASAEQLWLMNISPQATIGMQSIFRLPAQSEGASPAAILGNPTVVAEGEPGGLLRAAWFILKADGTADLYEAEGAFKP